MITKEQFQVGDRVIISNVFCRFVYTIVRITKTQAIGQSERGYQEKFKRVYENLHGHDHEAIVRRIPEQEYDMNKYKVLPFIPEKNEI